MFIDSAYKIAEYFELFADKILDPDKIHSVEQLETVYLQPILTKVIVIITTVALFMLLSVILMLLVNLINKRFLEKKDGSLSKVNKLLGGAFGLIRSAIPITAGCVVLNLLASLIDQSEFTTLVQNSWTCSFIAGIF